MAAVRLVVRQIPRRCRELATRSQCGVLSARGASNGHACPRPTHPSLHPPRSRSPTRLRACRRGTVALRPCAAQYADGVRSHGGLGAMQRHVIRAHVLVLDRCSASPSRRPHNRCGRRSPDSVGLSAERLERLGDALQAYVDKGEVAGSVTLVARRGRIAYFEAFGQRDREANAPMQTDAIFRIASQSKAIVSVAAMTLVEEGKLLLTDPVGKYLPELMETKVAVARDGGGYEVVKAARPITVRDLLTHTSGFGYGTGVGGDLWTAAGQTGYYFAGQERDDPRLRAPHRDACRRTRSRARSGSTATAPTSSARSSRSWPASRSTKSCASGSSSRSACATRSSIFRAARKHGSRPSTRKTRASSSARRRPETPSGKATTSKGRARLSRAAPACSRRPPTTLASCRCC